MTISLLIAISFSIGFFVESIVGFGGGLIAYSALSFFMDLKEMILAGLYIGTCASFYIFYGDRKFFDKKVFLTALPISLIGTIIGVAAFSKLSAPILSLIFALLLIFLSSKIFFFDNIVLPRFFKNKMLLIGGISQGVFGTGGPFFVNALKNELKNKSALRTTMAAFFFSFNIVRFIQLYFQQELKIEFFSTILWTIIPVFVAIKLGHLIHVRINEDLFKKLIALVTFFAGIKFLVNYFYM